MHAQQVDKVDWVNVEIPPSAKEAEVSYRKVLREMKKLGITLDDLPEDVQQSMLHLHQNALLVCYIERRKRDNERDS